MHHFSVFDLYCDNWYFMQTDFTNVSLQEMAQKKLPTKRLRKDAAREGSSVAPQVDVEFDGHRFRSEEHQR